MTFKAFTIIDLVVGMVISSLVISLGIGAFFSLKGSIQKNMSRQKDVVQKSLLRNLLLRDMEKSDSISLINDDIVFFKAGKQILWNQTSRQIYRRSNEIGDTLDGYWTIETHLIDRNLVESISITDSLGWKITARKDYNSIILR